MRKDNKIASYLIITVFIVVTLLVLAVKDSYVEANRPVYRNDPRIQLESEE